MVLQSAGVDFYTVEADLTIRKVIDQFRQGTLKKVSLPTSRAGGPGRGRGLGFGRNRF